MAFGKRFIPCTKLEIPDEESSITGSYNTVKEYTWCQKLCCCPWYFLGYGSDIGDDVDVPTIENYNADREIEIYKSMEKAVHKGIQRENTGINYTLDDCSKPSLPRDAETEEFPTGKCLSRQTNTCELRNRFAPSSYTTAADVEINESHNKPEQLCEVNGSSLRAVCQKVLSLYSSLPLVGCPSISSKSDANDSINVGLSIEEEHAKNSQQSQKKRDQLEEREMFEMEQVKSRQKSEQNRGILFKSQARKQVDEQNSGTGLEPINIPKHGILLISCMVPGMQNNQSSCGTVFDEKIGLPVVNQNPTTSSVSSQIHKQPPRNEKLVSSKETKQQAKSGTKRKELQQSLKYTEPEGSKKSDSNDYDPLQRKPTPTGNNFGEIPPNEIPSTRMFEANGVSKFQNSSNEYEVSYKSKRNRDGHSSYWKRGNDIPESEKNKPTYPLKHSESPKDNLFDELLSQPDNISYSNKKEDLRRTINLIEDFQISPDKIPRQINGICLFKMNLKEAKREYLGRGSYGDVWKLSYNQRIFACKKIMLKDFRSQEPWALFENPGGYLPELYGVVQINLNVYILMEFIPTVLHLVPRIELTEHFLKDILYKMMEALEVLNEAGFMHRDLKASNIGIADNGELKILDWGSSCNLTDESRNKTSGGMTLHFMSPGLCKDVKEDLKGDVYAVACTVIQLVTGKTQCCILKERGVKGMEHKNQICSGKGHFALHQLIANTQENEVISPRFADLLCDMVKYDTEERSGPKKIMQNNIFRDIRKSRSRNEIASFNKQQELKERRCKNGDTCLKEIEKLKKKNSDLEMKVKWFRQQKSTDGFSRVTESAYGSMSSKGTSVGSYSSSDQNGTKKRV